MKPLFFLPFCCVLFVLSGLMTSCVEPAVEKPSEKPEASATVAAKKESAAAPAKPQTEKPAEKPEASAAVAAKEEPAVAPVKPQVEKPAEKPEASKPAAAPDKAQLEQAGKAIAEVARREAEVARREAEKKNAPKPKIVQAVDLPVVEVTAKQGTNFDYNTGMGGDEQGAIIKVHPKHSDSSKIWRPKSLSELLLIKASSFAPIYRYRSKPDYIGEDSVELEYSDHELGSGPDDPGTTTITRQVINITVVADKKK